MKNLKLSCGVGVIPALYAVFDDYGTLVISRIFDRSKTRVASAAATLMDGGSGCFTYEDESGRRRNKNFYGIKNTLSCSYKAMAFGRDKVVVGTIWSKLVGDMIFCTTRDSLETDFHRFLMQKFELPLLPEWAGYIFSSLEKKGRLRKGAQVLTAEGDSSEYTVMLSDKEVPLTELVLVRCFFDQQDLADVVSQGLSDRAIRIAETAQKPMDLAGGIDSYMAEYGHSVRENVDKVVRPLVPLIDKVEGFVTKKTRPYPQQAAVMNGIISLYEKGEKYGLLTCGMGCGKTLMGIGTVEGAMNKKWLRQHPGKTLKDMYLDKEDKVSYRAIVMPPGHLVEKWKREILREVPGAKAEIINDLSQLVSLREAGKKPSGREWYIIGKDFAKLGSTSSPIPTVVSTGHPEMQHCKDCYEQDGEVVDKVFDNRGRSICPRCGGRKMLSRRMTELPEERGLVCPCCGKLLLTKKVFSSASSDEDGGYVLKPSDFSSKKDSNSVCLSCGAPLWGVNARPVGGEAKEPRWYKVSHYTNYARKNRATAWVLKGHEAEYFAGKTMLTSTSRTADPLSQVAPEFDCKKLQTVYGSRKVSPSQYIKRYLKGYFDFCILDEVHKYAGAGTAQSCAAHALVKASKFTMGLTGTLTNGKADSLFYLLWMLDPVKMVKKGFTHSAVMQFSQKYGCVETAYSYDGDGDDVHNSSSRGRMISKPTTKPGISPLVYVDFLLGHSVSMDLSDMTSYMPPLKEYVELTSLPSDVSYSYRVTTEALKGASREKLGKGILSEMLQFCLSYPDKPYGRKPILHPYMKDTVVAMPENYEMYKDTLLPKEERIVEIVKQEMSEGRNVFIFANFTGKEETNVTERIRGIVEKHCNMKGRVEVLRADSPEAVKREAYIHSRAKAGVKVVITNAKVCETGLDFCFEEDGVFYNYPTIIFMQPTYELATMMQASRRHYRLNQTEECRTYWMAYEGTLQAAALQIMASKQVAASAIQGKFSAEGLASMAQGVDPRVLLVQKLSSGDNSSREELSSMFDVLARGTSVDDDAFSDYVPPLTYFELMGTSCEEAEPVFKVDDIFDSFMTTGLGLSGAQLTASGPAVKAQKAPAKSKKKASSTKPPMVDLLELCQVMVNEDVAGLWENHKPVKRQKKLNQAACVGFSFF